MYMYKCVLSVSVTAFLQSEVEEIRNNMAEYHSHLQSYDAQLNEVKRLAGDATNDVTKVDERVQLLHRNVSSLKDRLKVVQSNHKDTVDNLDLLSAVS